MSEVFFPVFYARYYDLTFIVRSFRYFWTQIVIYGNYFVEKGNSVHGRQREHGMLHDFAHENLPHDGLMERTPKAVRGRGRKPATTGVNRVANTPTSVISLDDEELKRF